MIRTTVINGVGSGILIDVDTRQFFVTAKHLFQAEDPPHSLRAPRQLDMHVKGRWVTYPVCKFGWRTDLDMAVIEFDWKVSMPPIELGTSDTWLGQDLVILGFPNGLFCDGPDDTLPIAGRAILSRIAQDSIMLIQCAAFHGFSGGPVVDMTDLSAPKVIGIISQYYAGPTPMKYAQGHDVPTGFVECVHMDIALDIIENQMLIIG